MDRLAKLTQELEDAVFDSEWIRDSGTLADKLKAEFRIADLQKEIEKEIAKSANINTRIVT